MEKEPIYFLKLELENVRCFGEKAALDLSDGNGNWRRWTVILGDNGTGKTTLLQCLAGMELIPDSFDKNHRNFSEEMWYSPTLYKNNHHIIFFNLERDTNSLLTCTLNRQIETSRPQHLKRTDSIAVIGKIKNFTNHNTLFSYNNNPIPEFEIMGYGANRFINNTSFEIKNFSNSETLFNDDAKLINAETWLLEMDYAASRESEIKAFAEKRRDLIKSVLLDLLPDIEDIQFTTPTKEKLTPSVEFKTVFGYWVSINQLSLGYKTMVAWMVDVAARLFHRYPDSDNPLAEPAIILVDEIDLHLHPKWQRKIFDYLTDKFPQTQFIVTAHSPLVVQSAPKDANIVVLRKEGDKVVIDNDVKSVNDWRIDQILSSELFGNIPPRSKPVEDLLEKRRVLIQKKELTQLEEIELGKLNEAVDKLPYSESETDNEAKEIIRKAAEFFKNQNVLQ